MSIFQDYITQLKEANNNLISTEKQYLNAIRAFLYNALLEYEGGYFFDQKPEDIDALVDGLNDGTIDAICSDHTPHDIEDKKLEFNFAKFGIIGLETAFASMLSATDGKVKLETLVEKLTTGPQTIFNLSQSEIKEGEKANLTLFNPEMTWAFEKSDIQSKSKNTPFVGTEFKGKVLGIIC